MHSISAIDSKLIFVCGLHIEIWLCMLCTVLCNYTRGLTGSTISGGVMEPITLHVRDIIKIYDT